MQPRQSDYFKLAEAGFKHLFALEGAFKNGPLEQKLLHLVKAARVTDQCPCFAFTCTPRKL